MRSVASVCLSCSCSNFWKPWPRNFTFGCKHILRISSSYQGHRVKIKVTKAKTVYAIVTKHTHSRVVGLRLKDIVQFFVSGVTSNSHPCRKQHVYGSGPLRWQYPLVSSLLFSRFKWFDWYIQRLQEPKGICAVLSQQVKSYKASDCNALRNILTL